MHRNKQQIKVNLSFLATKQTKKKKQKKQTIIQTSVMSTWEEKGKIFLKNLGCKKLNKENLRVLGCVCSITWMLILITINRRSQRRCHFKNFYELPRVPRSLEGHVAIFHWIRSYIFPWWGSVSLCSVCSKRFSGV